MTANRKRGRNNPEDEVEFMPLSKRINNLHINNSLLLENSQGRPLGAAALNFVEWGPGPPYFQNGIPEPVPETPPESVQSVDWNAPAPLYTPDLDERENPHYYSINKLLFEMHVQRLQRTYP